MVPLQVRQSLDYMFFQLSLKPLDSRFGLRSWQPHAPRALRVVDGLWLGLQCQLLVLLLHRQHPGQSPMRCSRRGNLPPLLLEP